MSHPKLCSTPSSRSSVSSHSHGLSSSFQRLAGRRSRNWTKHSITKLTLKKWREKRRSLRTLCWRKAFNMYNHIISTFKGRAGTVFPETYIAMMDYYFIIYCSVPIVLHISCYVTPLFTLNSDPTAPTSDPGNSAYI